MQGIMGIKESSPKIAITVQYSNDRHRYHSTLTTKIEMIVTTKFDGENLTSAPWMGRSRFRTRDLGLGSVPREHDRSRSCHGCNNGQLQYPGIHRATFESCEGDVSLAWTASRIATRQQDYGSGGQVSKKIVYGRGRTNRTNFEEGSKMSKPKHERAFYCGVS